MSHPVHTLEEEMFYSWAALEVALKGVFTALERLTAPSHGSLNEVTLSQIVQVNLNLQPPKFRDEDFSLVASLWKAM